MEENQKPGLEPLADRLELFLQTPNDNSVRRREMLVEIYDECTKSETLAKVIWDYFHSMNKEFWIVQALVNVDVQETTKIEEILDESSVTSKLFYHSFSQELGQRYLQFFVGKHLDQLLQKKTSEKTALTEVAENLLLDIFAAPDLCPGFIREALQIFHQAFAAKYPKNDAIDYLSTFFFQHFICASIHNPSNWFPDIQDVRTLKIEDLEFIIQFMALSLGIPSGLTENRLPSDIQADKKERFRTQSKNFFKEIINPESIANVKLIVASSVELQLTELNKLEARDELIRGIKAASIDLNSYKQVVDIQADKLAALKEIKTDRDWRGSVASKKDHVRVWVKPEDDGSISVKQEVSVAAPRDKCISMYESEVLNKSFDPALKKLDILKTLPPYGRTERALWRLQFKMPFPFKDRDCVYTRCKDVAEDMTISWCVSVTDPEYAPKKGIVRLNLINSALLFHDCPYVPGNTLFTYYFRAGLGNSLPGWMVNAYASDNLNLAKRYKKMTEKHFGFNNNSNNTKDSKSKKHISAKP